MNVDIKILSDDTYDHLESLEDWLRLEPELRGNISRQGALGDSSLGTGLEFLTVALSSGGALSVLAASLSSWLSQPRRSDVTVRINKPGGESVEIDAKRIKTKDAQEIISQIIDGTAESS